MPAIVSTRNFWQFYLLKKTISYFERPVPSFSVKLDLRLLLLKVHLKFNLNPVLDS